MPVRYKQLDSLRGLAALSVLLGHFFGIVNPSIFYTQLSYTPLYIVVAGHEAVMFFFVLSGFVLALPFFSNATPTYGRFVVKRLCRIYIPYSLSVLFAITLDLSVSRHGIASLSSWFNQMWTTPITGTIIRNFILLIDNRLYLVDPVIWSLVYELRISIIFPLLIMVLSRISWKAGIYLVLLLSLVSFVCIILVSGQGPMLWLFKTLHYSCIFIIGILLAKYREWAIRWYAGHKRLMKHLLLLIGVLLYTYPYWFMRGAFFHVWLLDDVVTALGGGMFIVAAISSARLARVLHQKHVHFLGKISYSLYLYHIIVLYTLVNLLYGIVSIPMTWLLSFIASVAVAALAYYYVELPSTNLGRYLTRERRRVPVTDLIKTGVSD